LLLLFNFASKCLLDLQNWLAAKMGTGVILTDYTLYF
jgi:hypothetical protein